jgi:hypothetical protein
MHIKVPMAKESQDMTHWIEKPEKVQGNVVPVHTKKESGSVWSASCQPS